jgi:DNA gyrase/topoisomerase IV subunit A
MIISKFFNNEFASYANYDSFRSIGNYIDGFKPTARKLITTADIQKITEPTKLSSFVNKMSDLMEYLHGPVAAEGVAVGLAQNFTGTNNINLMSPNGSFGTRTIPRAAASRYIKTCKEPTFDKIFNPIDKLILIDQYFEGTKIEPRFYVPIIPMMLVNGSEGIGNGFAQKILPRDPKVLISFITKRLLGKKTESNVLPYYKGFVGEVKRIEGNSFEIRGTFERTNSTTILVTELPIGYDSEKYNNVLAKLEDDKIISDYNDNSVENKFEFEIKVTREFSKNDDEWILNKLKLIRRVTENFTCIGEQNEIVEFLNENEIIEAFIKVRLKYYDIRKTYQIAKLKKELLILGAKYWFIKLILDDIIIINKKTKDEISKQITLRSEFPFGKLENYDELLNMPIHSLSKETFDELKKQIKKKQDLKVNISDKTIESMWTDELTDLGRYLK